MNLSERAICDGLDDASIIETVAWIKEQSDRLQLELERVTTVSHCKGGGQSAPPIGERAQ